jgi:hypothetical protein
LIVIVVVVVVVGVVVVVRGGGGGDFLFTYMFHRAGSELYDSHNRERVKFGHESRGTRKQE